MSTAANGGKGAGSGDGSGQPPGLTRNQSIVLAALRSSVEPIKAYDLLEQVKEKGLRSPMTVYRALAELCRRGLASKLESVKAYTARLPEGDSAPVFLICENCGNTKILSDPALEHAARALAEQDGLSVDRLRIEVTGFCCGT